MGSIHPCPNAQAYQQVAIAEDAIWADFQSRGVCSWADRWQLTVAEHADALVVQQVSDQRPFSYRQLDQMADNIAHWAVNNDVGSSVAIYLPNSAAFLACVIGLAKAGVTAVLLNTQVPEQTCCLLAKSAGADLVLGQAVAGLQHQDAEVLLNAPWHGPVDPNYRQQVQLNDPAVVIFTSGTTGLSKPALFSHRRLIGAGVAWGIRTDLQARQNCYITLPLYHGNGLAVAFATCVQVGACAVLRDRFSASQFASDVEQFDCVAAVYIGELWRYIGLAAGDISYSHSPLTTIFGNGLTEPLWQQTLDRFGIERVVEHYGATEMPAGALTNFTGRPGYCGYIPPAHPDMASVLIVDEQGVAVDDGEPGEVLLAIPDGHYRGYMDPELDEQRLCCDVVQTGDRWWRSGDRLVRDPFGYFRFVERLGDSYRWKGENVSIADVEQALYAHHLVDEALVVGIHLDSDSGKLGLASITAEKVLSEADFNQILLHLQQHVAAFSLPLLMRQELIGHQTTATLKFIRKIIADNPFVNFQQAPYVLLVNGRYQTLTVDLLERIQMPDCRWKIGQGLILE